MSLFWGDVCIDRAYFYNGNFWMRCLFFWLTTVDEVYLSSRVDIGLLISKIANRHTEPHIHYLQCCQFTQIRLHARSILITLPWRTSFAPLITAASTADRPALRPRETILRPLTNFQSLRTLAPLWTLFKFIDQPKIWNEISEGRAARQPDEILPTLRYRVSGMRVEMKRHTAARLYSCIFECKPPTPPIARGYKKQDEGPHGFLHAWFKKREIHTHTYSVYGRTGFNLVNAAYGNTHVYFLDPGFFNIYARENIPTTKRTF